MEQKKKRSKKKWLWLILPIVLLLLAVIAAIMGRGGFIAIFRGIDASEQMEPKTFVSKNELTLPYRISLPEGYDKANSYPLVLYLHGSGERGDDNKAQAECNSIMQTLLNEENKKDYPCIVVAPQCPEDDRWASWWVDQDDAFSPDMEEPYLDALMELLEQVKTEYSVDDSRVYISGVSMGGIGTWGMLMRYPDYFAAGVPVCGGGYLSGAERIKDIPIWTFHGNWDMSVPVASTRDLVAAVKSAGSNQIKYTEYNMENHFSWELAYREDDLFAWMFAQRKAPALNNQTLWAFSDAS